MAPRLHTLPEGGAHAERGHQDERIVRPTAYRFVARRGGAIALSLQQIDGREVRLRLRHVVRVAQRAVERRLRGSEMRRRLGGVLRRARALRTRELEPSDPEVELSRAA